MRFQKRVNLSPRLLHREGVTGVSPDSIHQPSALYCSLQHRLCNAQEAFQAASNKETTHRPSVITLCVLKVPTPG